MLHEPAMFWASQNFLASHHPAFSRIQEDPHPPEGGFEKRKPRKIMEQQKKQSRSKGGRPAKTVKRNKPLTVKCTLVEQKIIVGNARKANLTTSEYLRKLGLSGKVVMLVKTLPKEVLALTGALNHVGALLNQIAKKRNSYDELNALERADLKVLEGKVQEVIVSIKTQVR